MTMRGFSNLKDISNVPHVRVSPGGYCITAENTVISTVLGSCVSACIYDPVACIMGMNHFLLSGRKGDEKVPYYGTEAGRYGVHAMELLINGLLKLGAKRCNLVAKAFGGANVLQMSGNASCISVGDNNSRFIHEFLINERIPLLAKDLGGEQGRVIFFCHGDFSVYVRKMSKIAMPKIVRREHRIIEKRIERQETAIPDPDIW